MSRPISPPSPSPQSPSPYPRPHTSSNTSPTTHDNSDNDELEYSMDDSHIPTSSTPPFPSSLSVLSHTSSNSRPLKPPNLSPNLRLTRPSGLSPSHISNTTSPTFFSSPTSLSGPPVAGSGTNVAKKGPHHRKKRKKKDVGTVFQRDSPSAKKTLRSFLLNFTDDVNFSIKNSIDLHQHSLDTGKDITNVMVQEICVMKPDMTSLNLSKCSLVTDVGLWAIARHCTSLRHLTLSQCEGVTNIGLRSLAMKCTGVQYLDFSKCRNLDDNALRVIAAGMWGLQTFTLTGCPNITDSGIAEVARCCHDMRNLDVSDCEKVGEYGDKALLEVGKYCHRLQTLNMYGCKHVGDAGIKAIAKGCRELRELRLTGCKDLSGSAVKSLATHCTNLENLSISNCQKIKNKDIGKLAKHCMKLQNLDISECGNITAKGLKVLALECQSLITMNLSGCSSIDDDALKILATGCLGLRNLNLANCQAISEVGIREIAHGCTGIGYLNVSNCKAISRRFLMHLIKDLQFSDPAHTYFGYQPKPDADELRRKAKELQEMEKCAVALQRIIRGTLARGGVKEIKRAHIIKYQLPKAQAWVRGHLRRKKWHKVLRKRLEHWAASLIRASWRGLQDRRFVRRMANVKEDYDYRDRTSVHIQRLFRGHVGRKIMLAVRDEIARLQLADAQRRARLERAATIIERSRRGFVARTYAEELRLERERLRALERLRIKSARLIQRIGRGYLGRIKAKSKRAEKELYELQWRCARKLQAAWRGKKGRDTARTLREFRDFQRQTHAATKIQSAWRAFRGRHLGKVAASLAGLRELEQTAARRIQSCFRARQGRELAKEKRDAMAETLKRMRAVLVCQRVFRGHKGREKSAVQRALKGLEHKAKPLYAKLKKEEIELETVKEKIEFTSGVLEPLAKDTQELEKEIALIMRSKAKYWDSDRISGAPQRFVTDWLKIRLDEQIGGARDRVEELEDQIAELQIKEREKQRHIRHISRELIPLTTGTIEKTKYERTTYLRHKVRAEKAASTDIQKIFRGFFVRSAVLDPSRDFWIEDYDTTTGQNLYFNSWTSETRWRKPLGMRLSEDFNLAVKQGTGGGEDLRRAGGWVEMTDRQRNMKYFFNNSTNKYRWSEPEEFQDDQADTNDDWFDAQDLDQLIVQSSTTGKDIGTSWVEMCEMDVGETFYTNKFTGEARWSLSPRSAFLKHAVGQGVDMEALEEGEEEEEDIVIGHWRKVADSSGVYYINDATDESQWDPPQEFLDAGYT